MQRLVIGAPFGNYYRHTQYTSTLGTFTWHRRAGFLKRWWRVLRTVRPCLGGWVNQLGLPSPGIYDLVWYPERYGLLHDSLVSIHGFGYYEWTRLIDTVHSLDVGTVELNLSCPNVKDTYFSQAVDAARYALGVFGWPHVIAKVPPLRTELWVDVLYEVGVRHFHLCNTLPTPRGGLSGPVLKSLVMPIVERLANAKAATCYPNLKILAGGGVYTSQDARDYINAGADGVAVASLLLQPWHYGRLSAIANAVTALSVKED